jgi:hypothetical protein
MDVEIFWRCYEIGDNILKGVYERRVFRVKDRILYLIFRYLGLRNLGLGKMYYSFEDFMVLLD